MADATILAEQMFTDFTFVSSVGMYISAQTGLFSLESGINYQVLWDGDEYYCTAYAATMNGYDCVFLGNEELVKGESSTVVEPFVIYQVLANNYCAIGSVTDTQETPHTVGIYMVESESAIIIHDRLGSPVEYSGVGRIRVETSDGGTQEYSACEVTEATVELDFSGGDMVVEPSVGELFSKILIPQPPGLIEENIPEGMEIAGLTGTMAGGSKNIMYATGTLTGFSGDEVVVEHNMGVVPDLVIIYTSGFYYASTTISYTRQYIGVSSAFAEAVGNLIGHVKTPVKYLGVVGNKRAYYPQPSGSSPTSLFGGTTSIIDYPTANILNPVYGTNKNSFSLNNSASLTAGRFESTLEYTWVAIGGLT